MVPLTAEQRDRLEVIRDSGEILRVLLNDVLGLPDASGHRRRVSRRRGRPPGWGEQRLRVLAAEDNRPISWCSDLAGPGGYRGPHHQQRRAALEAWRTAHWDVLLMDIRMPVMDGLAATRAIRSAEAAQGARARRSSPSAPRLRSTQAAYYSLAAGIDCFVPKPIHFAQLAPAIAAAIGPDGRRPPQHGRSAAQAADRGGHGPPRAFARRSRLYVRGHEPSVPEDERARQRLRRGRGPLRSRSRPAWRRRAPSPTATSGIGCDQLIAIEPSARRRRLHAHLERRRRRGRACGNAAPLRRLAADGGDAARDQRGSRRHAGVLAVEPRRAASWSPSTWASPASTGATSRWTRRWTPAASSCRSARSTIRCCTRPARLHGQSARGVLRRRRRGRAGARGRAR